MVHSCSLDLADAEEPMLFGEIGAIIGVNHERVRQICDGVAMRFRRSKVLAEYADAKAERPVRQEQQARVPASRDASDQDVLDTIRALGPSMIISIAGALSAGIFRTRRSLERLIESGHVHAGLVSHRGRPQPAYALTGVAFPVLAGARGRVKFVSRAHAQQQATERQILDAIGAGEMSRSSLSALIGMSPLTAKDWLNRLRKKRLVDVRRIGKRDYLWFVVRKAEAAE